ncbi:MAG: HAD-IC family P-type ATPase, partial [bacterium]
MKIQGLNKEQVASRKKDGLVNNVDTNISKTKKQIIIEHTLTYFNGLNLLLALLIIFSGKFMNMAFIGVVVINTLMGIIQEFKVKKTIDQLAILNAETCRVLREEEEEIPLHEIVMDDLLFLEEGSQIPVDAEVVDTGFLEVNEALLTGEQRPIQKHNGDKLLGGSFVASGSCYARVCHVGHENYATQLIIKAKHAHRAASQMRDTIEKIIKIISIVIIPVGLILFRSQYYAYQGDLPMAIVKTVGGLVGMIPEGLVLLTSLSFVLGVGRLAAKNALVQQMEAIEALARVDVLCLDKTGTITTGELEVANVDYYSPSQEEVDRAIGAFVHLSSNHNMTQTCLKRYFEKPEGYQAGAEIPFSSARKYQAMTMNDAHYYLGAADLMVDESLSGKVNDYAAQGYRVLAFCQGDHLTLDFNELSSCELLALIIIRDVIKEDAVKTFDYLQKAGVQIVVLSGDNPLTVSRVCKKAEIHGADRYYNANQLPDDEQELAQLVEEIRV